MLRYPPKRVTVRGPKIEEVLALAKCAPTMVVCPEAAILQSFLVHARLLLLLHLISLLLQSLLPHLLYAISEFDLQVDAFVTAKAVHTALTVSFSGLGEEQSALALTSEPSETVALITALAGVLKLPLPRCIFHSF